MRRSVTSASSCQPSLFSRHHPTSSRTVDHPLPKLICCSTAPSCDPPIGWRTCRKPRGCILAHRHTRHTSRGRRSSCRGKTHNHNHYQGNHPHRRLDRHPAVSSALLTVSSVLFHSSACSSILPFAWRLATAPVETSTFS
jgi:hypothetical protein